MRFQQREKTQASKVNNQKPEKKWKDDGAFNSFIKDLGLTIITPISLLRLPPLLDKVEVSGIDAIMVLPLRKGGFYGL